MDVVGAGRSLNLIHTLLRQADSKEKLQLFEGIIEKYKPTLGFDLNRHEYTNKSPTYDCLQEAVAELEYLKSRVDTEFTSLSKLVTSSVAVQSARNGGVSTASPAAAALEENGQAASKTDHNESYKTVVAHIPPHAGQTASGGQSASVQVTEGQAAQVKRGTVKLGPNIAATRVRPHEESSHLLNKRPAPHRNPVQKPNGSMAGQSDSENAEQESESESEPDMPLRRSTRARPAIEYNTSRRYAARTDQPKPTAHSSTIKTGTTTSPKKNKLAKKVPSLPPEPNSSEDEQDEELWCTCQKPAGKGLMVCCDGPHCKYEWFHFKCVGLKAPPKGDWYCGDCIRSPRVKRILNAKRPASKKSA